MAHRSVFGGIIEKNTDFPLARGFGFSRNTQPLKERVDFGIDRLLRVLADNPHSFIGGLDEVVAITDDVGGLLNQVVQNPINGSEFFGRNPKREIPNFVNLLVDSRLHDESVKIVVPVCPDYGEVGYQLRDGVGPTAKKALNALPRYKQLFNKFGFPVKTRIDLADVEAFNSDLLKITHESTESFLGKLSLTRMKIERDALRVMSPNSVEVGYMSSVFTRNGVRYIQRSADVAREIISSKGGDMRKVFEQLIAERTRLGDFAGVSAFEIPAIVAIELGGYAAYGEGIAGEAIIASPDAMSAIPAYHFAVRKSEQFSPVIYIRK